MVFRNDGRPRSVAPAAEQTLYSAIRSDERRCTRMGRLGAGRGRAARSGQSPPVGSRACTARSSQGVDEAAMAGQCNRLYAVAFPESEGAGALERSEDA